MTWCKIATWIVLVPTSCQFARLPHSIVISMPEISLRTPVSSWGVKTSQAADQVYPSSCTAHRSLFLVTLDLWPPPCSISHFVPVIPLAHDHSRLTLPGQAGSIDKTIICWPFIWFSISIRPRTRREGKDCIIDFSTLQQYRRVQQWIQTLQTF